ncbi:TetR family transcriptional regulator [Kribbella sp. ALI-6-A]|uniref:TetR/AcrR family transcriptional regulator n=1 Tax=Kribbella sp. ALI-6-A TaxID=1933817 RepID=UPI00097BB3AA|nr:TetR/AcrR family transcriptional regulator [Kribbella sp. ALI-6-A]ONI67326.1 TetR family transcriptional regulator [Kribbella sp. ALI-6-A]
MDHALSAEDRKKQLVRIGLMMLRTQPIHELSIDAIVSEAGVSRSVLFEYFPSKHDYYLAVISAAGRRMLRLTKPDASRPRDEQLREMLLALVAFISRRRRAYISFVRGAAGGDEYAVEVYAQTRDTLADRVLDLLDVSGADREPAAPERMRVHAWFAYVEDLAIEWSGLPEQERRFTDQELVAHAIDALQTLRKL